MSYFGSLQAATSGKSSCPFATARRHFCALAWTQTLTKSLSPELRGDVYLVYLDVVFNILLAKLSQKLMSTVFQGLQVKTGQTGLTS